MIEQIKKAVEVLRKGGVILYPTDTVWGIGCDATNKEAVAKVYEIKRRSDSKSLVLLASDLDMIRDIMRLFEKGHPLTIETGKNFSTTCCELPTDNFLIIFDGAFYGIDEIVKKRLNLNKTIGFSSKSNDDNINYQKLVIEDDLIEWGYPPELLGRIGEVLALNPLSSETIFEIMKTAKDNILNYHIEYCSNNNIDLSFSDEALQYVADKAYSSGLGFRNVKTILSKALNNFYYELSENQTSNNRRSIEIDKEYFKKSIG